MLTFSLPDSVPRRDEPVIIGVPLPRGYARQETPLALRCDSATIPSDAQALDRWPDGSPRWVLLAFRVTADGGGGIPSYDLQMSPPTAAGVPAGLEVQQQTDIIVRTGGFLASVGTGMDSPLRRVWSGGHAVIDVEQSGLKVALADGSPATCRVHAVTLECHGGLRTVVAARSVIALPKGRRLEVDWRIEFWAGLHGFICHLTIRNPHRARHPGGYWELGDDGSILLKAVDFRFTVPSGEQAPARERETAAYCSAEPGHPHEPVPLPFVLYQESSGGEHWHSRNHLNRHGQIPLRFRGYRRSDRPDVELHRASPVVSLATPSGPVSMCLRHFWQNFPKAFRLDATGITLSLFPEAPGELHELQGGEQKTHSFAVLFGRDTITDVPLHWFRQPLVPRLDPAWVASTQVIPYLTPAAEDPHDAYKSLVVAAIEGDDTFAHKREVVDEYGWRHFGDVWGDHETRFPVELDSPQPLLSHYNNQYDQVAGFCYQWLRTGDPRWWSLFDEAARHVVDIDIYHTHEDKAAYNHGLFWHTVHYVDAGRSTHRSYPRAKGSPGGGPANEHNYPGGLALHYFLTGDPGSRDAAIGLARFVIDMDDGDRTVFRWLARRPTGLASQSREPGYHGPGRGSGNSVLALLVGHQLTRDPRFLDKAEELIRRCVHPEQDIEALNLLDAENRWFYTMFLQALGRYLDYKAELGQLDDMYAYGRAALLHFARWMARFERPYLERPEVLEYPTETWVAQDMRKCEVFQYASRHARGEEHDRFAERAGHFFEYVTRTLPAMPTRTFCRPVVLMLTHGWSRAWFRSHPDLPAPEPRSMPLAWPRHERFVPQKAVALRRAKVLAAGGAMLTVAALGLLLAWLT